jgi:transposase
MPWKITDKLQARRAFIAAYWEQKWTMSALCQRFGISRQRGYEWLVRAMKEGWRSLADRSHCAKRPSCWQRDDRRGSLRMRRKHPFAGLA